MKNFKFFGGKIFETFWDTPSKSQGETERQGTETYYDSQRHKTEWADPHTTQLCSLESRNLLEPFVEITKSQSVLLCCTEWPVDHSWVLTMSVIPHFVAQGQRLKGQRDSRENTTRQVRGLENKSVESRTFKELLTES